MKNKPKEGESPRLNWDFQKKWQQLAIKGSEADLVLFRTPARTVPCKAPSLFLAFSISQVFKEKEMKVDCTGDICIYIYLYIFFYNGSFGSEHTNKYKNNKDCTLLQKRHQIPAHPSSLTCSTVKAYHQGIFNLWLPHIVVSNDTFVGGFNNTSGW